MLEDLLIYAIVVVLIMLVFDWFDCLHLIMTQYLHFVSCLTNSNGIKVKVREK